MSLHIPRTTLPVILAALAAACIDPQEADEPELADTADATSTHHTATRQGDAPESPLFSGDLVQEPLPQGCEMCPHSPGGWGEIGDSFTCWCSPAQARDNTQWGRIWGTDIYEAGSQMCRAGVHAGAIGLDGGLVTATITAGQEHYSGTLRNTVHSLDWDWAPRSYTIAPGAPCCQTNDDCAHLFTPGPGGKGHDAIPFYCSKPEGSCDGAGTCQPRPDACTQEYDPVLGCDGEEYSNACEAAAAGVNVAGGAS